MTDTVVIEPRPTLKLPEGKRKTARKSQPAKFPNRLTICFADDQVATLAQTKKIYRASERRSWSGWRSIRFPEPTESP